MGLLKHSRCLDWSEIQQHKEKSKEKGIDQFIKVYRHYKDQVVNKNYWGDELECMLVGLNNNSFYLLLLADEVRFELGKENDLVVNPEFAGYMIETTPKEPYDYKIVDLYKVEENMQMRIEKMKSAIENVTRKIYGAIEKLEKKNISGKNKKPENFEISGNKTIYGFPLLCSIFPGLGLRNIFWDKSGLAKLNYTETKSKYFPDNAIANHPRFNSFQKNIQKRRGRCPEGYIPVMSDNYKYETINVEMIKIDSFGLGMGCCCLHTTLQTNTFEEGCYLYDQIGALSPLLLRISRASPISQGRLLSTETRWDILQFAADCRTDEERGTNFLISGDIPKQSTIPKSRFSSIDCYISESKRNISSYNDIPFPIHEKSYEMMIKSGVNEKMARHVSSLFVRDPLLIYEEMVDDSRGLKNIGRENIRNEKNSEDKKNIGDNENIEDKENIRNEKNTEYKLNTKGKLNAEYKSNAEDKFNLDDFLNIQTSNWRSVRFKPPENSGWRVEVRSLEIQPTAFENAAFSIFVFLLSRVIKTYNLNFYIPISLVDENFRRANMFIRKSAEFKSKLRPDTQQFFYRKNILDDGEPIIGEGTVDEIFNGVNLYHDLNFDQNYISNDNSNHDSNNCSNHYSNQHSKDDSYPGILYFIKKFIDEQPEDKSKTIKYIDFIEKRCKGELVSVSEWIRKFVLRHSEYKGDSYLSERIENDLVEEYRIVLGKNNIDHLKNE